MRLAIDLDGVVFNHMEGLNKTHGLHLEYEKEGFPYFFEKILGVEYPVVKGMFETINPDFVPLFPGVKDALRKLNNWHHIFFLTSKTPKMMEWTKKVLQREGLDIFPVMVSEQKHLENCYDKLVEDCGQTWVLCQQAHKDCVLIDRAWNRDFTHAPRYASLGKLADSGDV